jgi:hypothetical protein
VLLREHGASSREVDRPEAGQWSLAEQYRSGTGLGVSGQDRQQRGLTRPVRAHESQNLSDDDLEMHVVQNGPVTAMCADPHGDQGA